MVVFDHNVRKTKTHHEGGQEKIKGGNAVQTPLQIVHGDYTLASAPLRVRMLSDKPKVKSLIAPNHPRRAACRFHFVSAVTWPQHSIQKAHACDFNSSQLLWSLCD